VTAFMTGSVPSSSTSLARGVALTAAGAARSAMPVGFASAGAGSAATLRAAADGSADGGASRSRLTSTDCRRRGCNRGWLLDSVIHE
jgi:hypothetical protein